VTTIYHEADASPDAVKDSRVAVVGYGNQGRSWALNLRDSGLDVEVCVRADASREQATDDGFTAHELDAANDADVICVLVPDDVIPSLPLSPSAGTLTILASGYCFAFDRLDPDGDTGIVAPRMLGPEVRKCYDEGVGFITAVGVHRDRSGHALDRLLGIALAVGGLRQGAIEMTPMQEAVLDLAVEQVLSPALVRVNESFVQVMSEHGIPLEAIMCELFLSGEVERSYGLLRKVGFAGQFGFHSPTSQYGQLTRRGTYDEYDIPATMRKLTDDIESGRFADEWDAERDAGYPRLEELKERYVGEVVRQFEADLRRQLGQGAE
jgi:ketol-acid reductoisomerase